MIPQGRYCATSNASVYITMEITFLSVIGYPTALPGILSGWQCRSGWWSLFLHIIETEGRRTSCEGSEVKDLGQLNATHLPPANSLIFLNAERRLLL